MKFGIWVAAGLVIGAIYGLTMDDMTVGLLSGVGIGLALAIAMRGEGKPPRG